MKKNFVLDTNVLLHDPAALLKFADNTVVIPIYVIEEVDQFKKESSERGRNARQVARYLDRYREKGNLGVGVPLDNEGGGVLRVIFHNKTQHMQVLDKQLADNMIMSVALELQQVEAETETVFVTKDTNLRVRADAMGLKAVNYEESSVSIEQLYPGSTTLDVSDAQLRRFFSDGDLAIDYQLGNGHEGYGDAANNTLRIAGDDGDDEEEPADAPPTLFANEYILLRNRSNASHTALGRFRSQEGRIVPLRLEESGVWGLRPRNKEQHFALDALLDDRIKLVTLIGKAGTGKTLLALSAGLQRTIENQLFKRLLVSRPVFPLGRDIGHLPGSVEEKLSPWMQPIFDNVEFLLGLKQVDKRTGRTPDELMRSGLLQIEPLTFIRGRSIPNQYLIVDEAQNLTPHEVKTIITRVGQGTKVVLTGDPYQIDNPYVDSESNGLTYTINRFKGQPIAATVTLFKGERSELAELASNLL